MVRRDACGGRVVVCGGVVPAGVGDRDGGGVTGPLAQQFAQVRSKLWTASAWTTREEVREEHRDAALAALSVIERHVQDMEKALVELLVVAQTDDPWLIGGKRYRELLENARAALPAREKGEE